MDQHQWNTMSLSTIKPRHETRLFKVPKKSNQTSDIPGASVPKAYKFTNKPDYGCRVDDIAGARPMRLERSSNAISRITDCSDIEGAQPMPHGFKTIRFTDPMDPTYNLSVVKAEPMPVLKFLGDRNNTKDIDGAQPAPLYKWKQRKTMDLGDIEGAQAGWKPKHKRHQGPPRDNINVLDINGGGFKSKRVTDPLNPVHIIHGLTIEDDKRSRPRELPRKRNGPNLMNTRDIPGAYPGWVPPNKRVVRQVRPTNQTSDIMGAQADSFQHGIRTNRISNPLDPAYTGVDGSQLGSIKRPNTPPAAQSSFFRDMDTDGNGLVSTKEIMKKLDTDGDGHISSKEMRKYAKMQNYSSSTKKLMEKLDTDGDGQISSKEMSKYAKRPPMPEVARLDIAGQGETKSQAISRLEAEISRLRLSAPQLQMLQQSKGATTKPKTSARGGSTSRSRHSKGNVSARSQQQPPRSSRSQRSEQPTPRSSRSQRSERQMKPTTALSRSSRSSQRERPMTQAHKREMAQVAADKAMVANLDTPSQSSRLLQQAGKKALSK